MDTKNLLFNLGIALASAALVAGASIHIGPIFGLFTLGIILIVLFRKHDD